MRYFIKTKMGECCVYRCNEDMTAGICYFLNGLTFNDTYATWGVRDRTIIKKNYTEIPANCIDDEIFLAMI